MWLALREEKYSRRENFNHMVMQYQSCLRSISVVDAPQVLSQSILPQQFFPTDKDYSKELKVFQFAIFD
jgi:hypothetical protein